MGGILKALFLALCILGCLTVSSCFEIGSLVGVVNDARQGGALAGVQVRVPLWSVGSKVNLADYSFIQSRENIDDYVYTTVTTDVQGSYSFTLPVQVEGYNVTFTKPGYRTAVIDNQVIRANEEVIIETFRYIDDRFVGQGTVSGYVRNALNNVGEAGATLKIRKGFNVRSGLVFRTLTSAGDGSWSTSLESGYYTAELSKPGFTVTFIKLVALGQRVENLVGLIAPIAPPGQTRIILRWSDTPRDLDSHITGPLYGGRFHVYYGSKGEANQAPYTNLDWDVTNGRGPETVTIHTQSPTGTYRYSVHDFTNRGLSNSRGLAQSYALVEVQQNGKVVREFPVPATGHGTLWTVFELTGFTINAINTMSYQPSPSAVV